MSTNRFRLEGRRRRTRGALCVHDRTLFSKDKKSLLHVWESARGSLPLSKKSEKVKTKTHAKKHVNNSLFARMGHPVIFRVRVSHDVAPSLMESHSQETGMTIEHDHIQEKECTSIGFLVGAHPEGTNFEDMRASHENHSVLSGLRINFKDRTVNPSGNAKIPFKLQTQAIHPIVGASQAIDAQGRFGRVFGSQKEGGCPQGIAPRHAPDGNDPKFPTAPNTKLKIIKMMSKQKAFLDNTRLIKTKTIAGIHTVMDEIGECTLCQILMAIRSIPDPDHGLFIAIDELTEDDNCITVFTVHLERCEEALGIVPLFCVILEAKFGAASNSNGTPNKEWWCL
jgi:hypothetical protein